EKFKRNRFLPSSYIEKTKEFFDRYGAKTMVIARFVGFLRAAAPFLSGASKTRFREFIFFDFLGASAWTLVFALGGFYLGESFSLVEKYIGRGGVILFLSIVAVLVGRKVITSTVKAAQNLSRRYAGELLLSLSFLSGLGLIVYLSREARQADIIFELEILRFLSSMSNDFLTIVFAIFTAFGSGYFVTFTIIAALFAFILRKRYYEGLLFAVAVAISNLLSAILKIVIRTERPKIPLIVEPLRSFSFPSGHVVASSLIFWVLGWIIFRESKGRLKWLSFLFFAIPLGVGLSRLYFGYHWPVDVLGGYAVSFTVFSFWVYFYEKGLLRRKAASYGKDFHRNQ
ncbi:MAG: phosphatase PAP2 family protein, partial [Actinobacteria bacterium]|nr:phosphatase PAP2 family protein [Actinomycetota bacterium]